MQSGFFKFLVKRDGDTSVRESPYGLNIAFRREQRHGNTVFCQHPAKSRIPAPRLYFHVCKIHLTKLMPSDNSAPCISRLTQMPLRGDAVGKRDKKHVACRSKGKLRQQAVAGQGTYLAFGRIVGPGVGTREICMRIEDEELAHGGQKKQT